LSLRAFATPKGLFPDRGTRIREGLGAAERSRGWEEGCTEKDGWEEAW
jgi:hypothetical protein